MMDFYDIYYPACLIASTLLLIRGFYVWRGKYNMYCIGTSVMMTLVVLSYYFMYTALNFGESFLAYKLFILGECLLPPLTTFYLTGLCKIKIKKRFVITAFVISLMIYAFVIAPSTRTLSFGSLYISASGGRVRITEEPGYVHLIIYVLIGCYCLLDIFFVVYSVIKQKRTSIINIYYCIAVGFIAIAPLPFVMFFNAPFDYAVVCVICQAVFMNLAKRTNYYSLENYVASEIVRAENIGYVCFDDHKRLIGINDTAEEWFPELKSLAIDSRITDEGGVCTDISLWFQRMDNGEHSIFEYEKKNGRSIGVAMELFDYKTDAEGYRIIMRDDTDNQAIIDILSLERSEALKKKEMVEKVVESYVDPSVISGILSEEKGKVHIGSQKEVAVMFADIRGFTAFSEGKSPSEVLDVLNYAFEAMTACVLQNKGSIDKFIGDCIMAVWSLEYEPDGIYRACKTAIDMKSALREINIELKERYDTTIALGIGINTGLAVVGDVGTDIRRDFTCIGDTVNVASRLEEIAGVNEIIMAGSVVESLAYRISYEPVKEGMLLRGKKDSIDVFRLTSVGGRS